MFHVKHSSLFPNTEIPENHIQQILNINPPGNSGKGAGGKAKIFGNQFNIKAGRTSALQVVETIIKRGTMTGAGRCWARAGMENVGNLAMECFQQGIKTLFGFG